MIATLAALAAATQGMSQIATKFESAKKPRLLIIGFYHLANPGRDLVKSDLDDHLAPKRQAEIAELNRILATFKPTKIAVEEAFRNTDTNSRYEEFLSGKHSLTVNETEQVGFRLAKELGHKTIYPIDTKGDMDFETFFKKASTKVVAEMQALTTEMAAFMATFKDHSVAQNLRILNSSEADRLTNGFYLRMLGAVNEDKHPGADLVSPWWTRNLHWIANLTTVASDPNDRVLLICGAGHASLLRSILKDSLDLEVVSALQYLPEK